MPLRHFGIYRDVTPEQAKLDKTLVKLLFRWGTTQESEAAARCKTKIGEEQWKECVARLRQYNLVEYFDKRQSKYLRLSSDGQGWGMDLTCEAVAEETEAGAERQAERVRTQDFDYTK